LLGCWLPREATFEYFKPPVAYNNVIGLSMFIALLAVFGLSSYYNPTVSVFIAKHSSLNKQCFYGISLVYFSVEIFIGPRSSFSN
jgi:hypothetical protein